MGDAPAVLVHTMTVNDLTPDDFKRFTEHYAEFITEFVKDEGGKVKLTVVENVGGKDIIHQRTDP